MPRDDAMIRLGEFGGIRHPDVHDAGGQHDRLGGVEQSLRFKEIGGRRAAEPDRAVPEPLDLHGQCFVDLGAASPDSELTQPIRPRHSPILAGVWMSSPGLRGTSLRHDRTVASRFVVRTRAAVVAEELFDVSLDIDAHVASMERSGERAISGVLSGHIGLGQEVTWRARHFGVWFTMTSRITALDRPTRFVDEQVRGPFRSFRHEHRFDDVTGVTIMTDTIDLVSPIFGILAERAVLVPYLRRLIRVRNAHLLDGSAWARRPIPVLPPGSRASLRRTALSRAQPTSVEARRCGSSRAARCSAGA